MAEKDDLPMQGDLLRALDDLTELIAEQEQRGRVWSADQEDDEASDIDGFDFEPDDEEMPLLADTAAHAPGHALPSPAEIETLVDLVLSRRMDELREQIARDIMIELRKRHPEL